MNDFGRSGLAGTTAVLGVAAWVVLAQSAAAQCESFNEVTKEARRIGPNSIQGRVMTWASSGAWWTWTATAEGEFFFQSPGGSPTSLANGSGNGPLTGFFEINGTPIPNPDNPRWFTIQPLEPQGTGDYWTRGQGTFTSSCGDVGTIPWINGPVQHIERPDRPDYVEPSRFLTYLGGDGGFYETMIGTTFTTSVPLKPGPGNGALGSPTWVLIQSGPAGVYASLPCPTCANPTLVAQHESDSCNSFNVQVKTNYSGFLSEPLFVVIERPKRTLKPSEPQFQDIHAPDDITGLGYLSKIFYKVRGLCDSQGDLQGYKVNETFSSIDNEVDEGPTNWPIIAGGISLGPESKAFMDAIRVFPGAVCGPPPNQNEVCAPEPENPNTPLGTSVVQTADQVWRVGGPALPGSGIEIQMNRFRRFLDHGDHDQIVSPFD